MCENNIIFFTKNNTSWMLYNKSDIFALFTWPIFALDTTSVLDDYTKWNNLYDKRKNFKDNSYSSNRFKFWLFFFLTKHSLTFRPHQHSTHKVSQWDIRTCVWRPCSHCIMGSWVGLPSRNGTRNRSLPECAWR